MTDDQLNKGPIIVVAGLGRCGTSMVMKMLHAGGIQPYCEELASYETRKIMGLPEKHEWLIHACGKSVKLLDPHKNQIPAEYSNLIVLWIHRHPIQQAKSQIKLRNLVMGIKSPPNRREVRVWSKSLNSESVLAKKSLIKRSGGRMLLLSFENILLFPVENAQTIKKFIQPEFELDAAEAASVVKDRSTGCYDGFMEIEILRKHEIEKRN